MNTPNNTFEYSQIRGVRDTKPEHIITTWDEFVESLKSPVIRGQLALIDYLQADRKTQTKQKNGKAWIPAKFQSDGTRSDKNVETISAFVADLDNKSGPVVTEDSIRNTLKSITYATHTSYSHSLDKPKWRVIIPFSQPCSIDRFPAVFEYFQSLFEGTLDCSCRNPSHLFYLPSCPPMGEKLYQFFQQDDVWFNPKSVDQSASNKKPKLVKSNQTNNLVSIDLNQSADINLKQLGLGKAIKNLILTGQALKYQSRSEAVFAVICTLVSKKIDDKSIMAILLNPKYKISDMPREKCQKDTSWLVDDINRAKDKILVPFQNAIDLIERILPQFGANPGMAFEAETIEALTLIKARDKSAYMNIRAEIKNQKVPITFLEKELGSADTENIVGAAEHNPEQSVASEMIAKANQYLKYDMTSDSWIKYSDGFWNKIEAQEIQILVQKIIKNDAIIFPEGYTSNYASGVITLLKGFMPFGEWNTNRSLIPFKNGVLDLDNQLFFPHSQANKLAWQLNYDYLPKQHCQPIIDWLYNTLKNDVLVQCLRAYLNAIVKGRSDLHRFLEVVGPGGSGKSTFLKLAMQLVGESNTISTELKHLENNRFEAANLFNKRLILIADAERYTGDVSVLKSITGGDPLRIERKYVQTSGHFIINAMVLIASNESIQSSEYTSGLYRRRLTIHFDNPIPLEKQRNLETEFKPYLPGLINWVLSISDEEVNRLLKPAQSDKIIRISQKRNILETNPLASWLHQNVGYSPGFVMPIGVARKMKDPYEVTSYEKESRWLYPNYVKFCETSGSKPIALQRFSRLLDDLCCHQLGLKNSGLNQRSNKGRSFKGLNILENG
ncbi:MAG: hypothetical protein HON94_08265, partial [Methylococcales bacterium]|nr:hypothetical protein [Methylococcales bacterium]